MNNRIAIDNLLIFDTKRTFGIPGKVLVSLNTAEKIPLAFQMKGSHYFSNSFY